MINFLSNWVEQITVTVIIVSIFELILPNGNIKKYIKVVLGVYIVFSIISPFVDSKALYDIENTKLDSFLDDIEKEGTEVNSQSMDSRLQDLYIKELKEDIAKKVSVFGYEIYKANIEADFQNTSTSSGIHKIDLILKKKGQIDKIEEVNIVVGESKKSAEPKEKEENKNMDENIEIMKNDLAKSYEIEPNIINIKVK